MLLHPCPYAKKETAAKTGLEEATPLWKSSDWIIRRQKLPSYTLVLIQPVYDKIQELFDTCGKFIDPYGLHKYEPSWGFFLF